MANQTFNFIDSAVDSAAVQSAFFNRIFGWMFAGLGISGVVAYLVATRYAEALYKTPGVMIGVLIATLLLVIILSAAINKISSAAATAAFIAYAALNGVMLSSVLLVYQIGSVVQAFFAAAATFGGMGLYGYVTKRDLSGIGSLCIMGLLGIIVASVINLFWYNSTADLVISILGVLIFVGLTAYDVQKIKRLAVAVGEGAFTEEIAKKIAIIGALQLYLDFVNIFLYLLRLFGRRR